MGRYSPLGVAVTTIFLVMKSICAVAQDQPSYPDWSGQWMRGPGMGTGWDPTKPQAGPTGADDG
jgi:hypothetical protein